MSNLNGVVNLFEKKLKKLLENYNFLKEENEVLYNKIAVLEHQITKEKQFNNEIEKKYQTLKKRNKSKNKT